MNNNLTNGFWDRLQKPIMALAPMDDVTDAAFRRTIAKYGKPDVMFTEFVSSDGLCSIGKEKLMEKLIFDKSERPVVVQFFGKNPDNFFKCGELAKELGFDGIDINMGCPDKNVCKSGAGAALINSPDIAKEVVQAVRDGSGLPISIKTRIGYDKITLEDWLGHLLEAKPAAITIHLRTKKEMSKVPARWQEVHRAVNITKGSGTLLIGNGDIMSLAKAGEIAAETGVDGVMLGRAIFGNPWLFNREVEPASITTAERLRVMIEHAYLYEKIFAGKKGFGSMKKHFKAYITGYPGAKELRMKLETMDDAAATEKAVKQFFIGSIV